MRFFPQPAVSIAIFGTWLLAQNGITIGNAALGAVLAVVIPRFSARFWPAYPERVRYGPLLRLAARAAVDVVIANLNVALLVLGPRRRLRPSFLVLPLATKSPYAITLLASVISLTPGTVSANLSGDRRTLLIHALAIDDPDAEMDRIKSRYESLILSAFGC